ncbi:pentatricopeptide repeat-containing protein [Rosa sericea]
MVSTSSPNSSVRVIKKYVVDGLKDKALDKSLEEHLNMIRDKDSLHKYGAKLYKSIAKFAIVDEALEQLIKVHSEPPTRTLVIGNNQVMSYTYSRNSSADDLKKHAMEVFKEATKDCEVKDMKEKFDMIQDYSSLDKSEFMFFNSMVNSGFLDEAEELLKKAILPVVAVHTYVIGVGVAAGNTNAALKAFQHMSASGVAPNSYTYAVLIKGLTADPNYCGDAKKFLLEMMDKGMRPNAATYTAVIEGFAKLEDKAAEEEGKQLVDVMMHKGFVPNAKAMMEVLKGRPTPLIRRVINIALSKLKG